MFPACVLDFFVCMCACLPARPPACLPCVDLCSCSTRYELSYGGDDIGQPVSTWQAAGDALCWGGSAVGICGIVSSAAVVAACDSEGREACQQQTVVYASEATFVWAISRLLMQSASASRIAHCTAL
jgi:hypothetical protein